MSCRVIVYVVLSLHLMMSTLIFSSSYTPYSTVNTQQFQSDAAAVLRMNAVIQPAEPEPTNAPTLPPGSPTQSPTTPPPTQSPTTPRPTIPSFLGYEYVGEGECRDDSMLDEGTYNYVPFESSSPDECPGKCALYYWDDNLGFRGFEFTTNPASTCKCLFDSDVEIPEIQQSTSSPSAQGEIFQVKVSSTNTTCYKRATTVEPPVDVAGYDYIGFGACLNDSNQRYNNTMELDATNLVECGEGCASVTDVLGFWALEDNFCTCLLNAPDATSSPTSTPSKSPTKLPSAIVTPTAEPDGGGSTTSTTSTASPPTTGSKSTKGRKNGKKGKGTATEYIATPSSEDSTTAKSSSKSSKTSSKSRRGLMEKQEQGQLSTYNTHNTRGSNSGKGFRRRTTATTRSGPITKSDFSEGFCYKIVSSKYVFASSSIYW